MNLILTPAEVDVVYAALERHANAYMAAYGDLPRAQRPAEAQAVLDICTQVLHHLGVPS